LKLTEEFRKNAAECLKLSQNAISLQAQGYWIAMAQFWFDLAVHAEQRADMEGADPACLPAERKTPKRRSPPK
jgi:hypothetical protein